MRLALLLAIGLALGGVAIATVPAASACTSDPDVVCGVIWTIECVGEDKPTTVHKRCL